MDSGAFISVAPKELAVNLGLVIKNCGHPPLRALGGNVVPVVGQIDLNIEYQGKTVILFGVPVIDEYGRSLILGQDWIQAVGGISIMFEDSYFLVDLVQQGRDKACADEDSPSQEGILVDISSDEAPTVSDVNVASKIESNVELLTGIFQSHISPETKVEVEAVAVPDAATEENLFTELPIAKSEHESLNSTMHLRLTVNVNTTALPLALTPVEVRANASFTGRAVVSRVWGVRKGREYATANSIVDFKAGVGHVFVLNATERPLLFHRGQRLGRAEPIDESAEILVLEEEPEPFDLDHPPDSTLPTERIQIGDAVSDAQREQLLCVLSRNHKCFPTSERRYGMTSTVQHAIRIDGSDPVHMPPYRTTAAARDEIRKQVGEMLACGVIEESNSPWAAPVVLVKRKDGRLRFCVDYRRLNNVTIKDSYPLPRIDDLLDHVGTASFFTSLDLASGYWQVPVRPEDREKTAFITQDGLFQFKHMPFGLCNAPATFQRLMDRVLSGLKWSMCLVYLDDVLIFSRDFPEHLRRLDLVLGAIQSAGLVLNLEKCQFCVKEIPFLGHVLTSCGIKPSNDKVRAILEYRRPKETSSLRSFLGLIGYYRRFVPDFAALECPLAALLRKNAVWKWTKERELAFVTLKKRLANPPVLKLFQPGDETIVRTDASGRGLGVVLSQMQGDDERPVAFLSRRLHDVETRYHSNELECLALVWGLRKLRHYLLGRPFRVQTDNSALTWLWSSKTLKGKFSRWALELQEFDFSISHVKGSQNVVADALSREPVCDSPLPCNESFPVYTLDPSRLPSREFALCQQGDRSLNPIFMRVLASPQGVRLKEGQFILRRRVLLQVNPDRGRKHRLVVPSYFRREVLNQCHDLPTGGHLGEAKTLSKVLERFWWPSVRSSTRDHVKSCLHCQCHKPSNGPPIGALKPIPPPQHPFEIWGLDHLGPFNETKSGNRHLIVSIDYLTKWIEVQAVPSTDAEAACRFVVGSIVSRYGSPRFIVSDQGTAFTAGRFEGMCDTHGIRHILATAAHPQTNGLVERLNKTLASVLAAYVNLSHDDWDEHLPLAVFAINSARQDTIDRTPFEMLYGRVPNLPVENRLPMPADPPEELTEREERLKRWREEARSAILKSQAKACRLRRQHSKPHRPFFTGQLVLLRRDIKQGKTAKFMPRFVGPFQIVQQTSPVTYLVESTVFDRRPRVWRRFRAHVEQLRPFHVREDADFSNETPDPLNEINIRFSPAPPEPAEEVLSAPPLHLDEPNGPQNPDDNLENIAEPANPVRPQRTRRTPNYLLDYIIEEPP